MRSSGKHKETTKGLSNNYSWFPQAGDTPGGGIAMGELAVEVNPNVGGGLGRESSRVLSHTKMGKCLRSKLEEVPAWFLSG